jgi:hypothetical protein
VSWFKRYVTSLGSGLTPETAALATRRAARTFLQAALAVVVAAGVGLISASVLAGAAVAGLAALASAAQNALGK